MQFILWRHAEADFHGTSDFERKLTPCGHEQAQRTANWLAKHLPEKYLLVCSQATRAQETASYLGEPLIDGRFNIGSGTSTIQLALEQLAREHLCPIVLVAHQPFLGVLAAEMTMSSDLSSFVNHSSGYWLEKINNQWRCKAVFSPKSQ